MPFLYVTVGLPGSGKSTWRERFMALHPEAVVISQDDLVEEFAKTNGLTYSEAFRQMDLKAAEAMVKARFGEAVEAGRDIVLDRTNMTKKSRRQFLSRAQGYKTHALVFEVAEHVLDYRLAKRAKRTGKSIPPHVIKMMRASYHEPDLAEFDSVTFYKVRDEGVWPRIRWSLKNAWKRVRRWTEYNPHR